MTQRWWKRGSLGAVLLAVAAPMAAPRVAAAAVSRGVQQVVVMERSAESTDTTVLTRLVTVQVKGATLRHAVTTVANVANVQIQFQSELLDAVNTPVTLHVTRRPLGEVLNQLLSGTRLQAVPIGHNMIGIEPAVAAHQGTGAIKGLVTDASTKRPVPGAAVSVDSGRPVSTRANGTFTILNVPPGLHRVSVRLIGYKVTSVPVTVREDETESVAITLTASAAVLNEVVTTATGDQRRYEVGNAVGTIKADSIVSTTLIRNMSDLLQARVPGVVVSNTSGDVGAPSKIRLRGINSLALNNDPIIILDGIRLNAQTTAGSIQTNVGSTQLPRQFDNPANGNYTAPLAPSRLDDIDPNTIESIDVLRGPSASSLYGTDAANGVIVIKTKKGHAGVWRTNLSSDIGNSEILGKMPEMWWGWGHYNNSLYTTGCNLAVGGFATVVGGACIQDSVTHFNPQNNAAMSTMGTGSAQTVSGNISGGTETLQQFFSAKYSDNIGMSKMSAAEQHLIARLWSSPAPSWMIHPNTEQNVDASTRTTVNPRSNMDISFSANGIYRTVLNGGNGMSNVGGFSGASPADTLTYLPSESQRTQITSTEKRGTVSTVANYRPWTWASASATIGGDYGLRADEANLRAQDCSIALQIINYGITGCPSGRLTTRGETFVSTANVGGQLSFTPVSWINLRTAFGEQYSHTNFYSLSAGNSDPRSCPLAFGTLLLSPNPVCLNNNGSQMFTVNEARDEAATAGVYLEETITVFGVYTTFGVRHDVASAFGGQVNKSPPNYPKFNFSYPLSEKSFFPKQPYVTSLRLRVAYGQSGNQASKTAVLNNYSLDQIGYGQTPALSNSVLVNQLGNPNLRPEKGTEWEGGFDISLLENERIHAEVTMYRKYTRDAITSLTLAPSFGVDNLSQFYNLGNVENRGLELSLTTRLLDSRAVSWDITVNAAKNTNKLVHKAASLSASGPLNTQFVEGYPLYGYWGVPVQSYADLNQDSILAPSEVTFGPLQFMGAPYPRGELTYSTGLALWNGAIRVSANLQQTIGQTTQLLVNNGGNFNPRGAVDRSAPLGEQAAYLQAVVDNNAYLGTSSSLRFNELSVTYTVPINVARRFHAQSLSVTAMGRNLALWSTYAGKDPNVDTSGLFGEATQDNALGTPQPRNLALRFNLGL